MGKAGKTPGNAGGYRRWREIEQAIFLWLIDFLTTLGQDVKITVTPARKQQGQLSLVVA
jgi:hypothetical protein